MINHPSCSRRRAWAFLLSLALLSPVEVYSQQGELLSVSTSGLSKLANPVEASREIQTKVMSDVAREQVQELLGSARFEKNKRLIESRIVRESARFIPFVKRSDPVQQADGAWKVNLELKVSLDSLRQMIAEQGLLGDEAQGGGSLALVSFVDRKRLQTWRWWTQLGGAADPLLSEVSRLSLRPLSEELLKSGFLLQTPLEGPVGVSPFPTRFRVDQPSSSDLRAMADFTRTSSVVLGEVQLRESPTRPGSTQIAIGFVFHQVSSGRVIAEVSRQFETEPGTPESTVRQKLQVEMREVARDFASQVQEAGRRGTLSSNLIQLVLTPNPGPILSQEFRSGLQRQVRDIRAIKERRIERDRLVLDVDFAGGDGAGLAQRLKSQAVLGRLEARVQSVTPTTVQVDLRVVR